MEELFLYKVANGDESLIFYISAKSLERAENLAKDEIEENYEEENWEHFSTTKIELKREEILDTFDNEDYW